MQNITCAAIIFPVPRIRMGASISNTVLWGQAFSRLQPGMAAPRFARRYNRLSVKDPLVGPLAAIAAGILVSRFVPFPQSEVLCAIAAFLLLGILAVWRNARLLAGVCCCLGLIFAGVLTDQVHAPGPPPEIDAAAREIVILDGCVVEPPAISGSRERFLLELEPHAR